jgi:hypothetical protein
MSLQDTTPSASQNILDVCEADYINLPSLASQADKAMRRFPGVSLGQCLRMFLLIILGLGFFQLTTPKYNPTSPRHQAAKSY